MSLHNQVSQSSVIVVDNFVSDDDCKELVDWALSNCKSRYFRKACGTNRLTTRGSQEEIPFPKVAYKVQQQIISKLGLQGQKLAKFYNGIYCGVSLTKEDVAYHAHKDPVYEQGSYTLHCNVVTTDTKGGDVWIDGHGVLPMNKGRLVSYPVSELLHEVSPGESDDVRNLWVFGFCIPRKD